MADDLDGHASIKREITGYGVYMSIENRTIPRVARGTRMRRAEMRENKKRTEERVHGSLYSCSGLFQVRSFPEHDQGRPGECYSSC